MILEQHGCQVRHRHNYFVAQCPAHNDGKHLSLSATLGRDGRQLVHCFNGCSIREIRESLDLPRAAFDGWNAYDHQRLRSSCRSKGRFPMALSICGVQVLNARALLAAEAQPVTIAVPPGARSCTRAVAHDLGVLLGTADSLGAGDYPLLYTARWAAKRLGADPSSVARALRSLVREGSIKRGPDVFSPATGRASYTYRRPR